MLTLEPIHGGNWRTPLSVREDQQHYVASPAVLLARAYGLRECHSCALYIALEGEPIGMVLYHDCPEENSYVLSQFFIDQRYQGQGYGYRAMQLVLEEMRRDGRFPQVDLCYCEGDEPARRLYEKCGFVPTGEVDEGEVIMRLPLAIAAPRSANTCRTYFAITGDFNPDEATAQLQFPPFESWHRGDPRPGGCGEYGFSRWCCALSDEYDPCTAEQMRRTIAPLREKAEALRAFRQGRDVQYVLQIVPVIRPYESTPCLAPPMDVIAFCHETRTEIDIDLYIKGD